MARLTARLGLNQYNVPAPLVDEPVHTSKVKIMLSQHIGAPATPVVKVNDRVQAAQVTAERGARTLGGPVHATLSGGVPDVNHNYVTIQA